VRRHYARDGIQRISGKCCENGSLETRTIRSWSMRHGLAMRAKHHRFEEAFMSLYTEADKDSSPECKPFPGKVAGADRWRGPCGIRCLIIEYSTKISRSRGVWRIDRQPARMRRLDFRRKAFRFMRWNEAAMNLHGRSAPFALSERCSAQCRAHSRSMGR